MKSEHVKNTAISTLVGATLVVGVITIAPGWDDKGPRPTPGAVGRAMSAVGTGTPASLLDLSALIEDRERWVRAHPRDEESWAVLGSAYVERGSRTADPAYYTQAQDALQRSVDVLPGEKGNVDALVGLAALANARHDFAKARTLGESAAKQKPRRWGTYPVLIDAYSGLGDYKAVGKAMDKLAKLHQGGQTLGRMAEVYRERGWREDAAAKAYDAVGSAESDAEKAAALHLLGDLSWERGEPEEAIEQYDSALKLAPDHHPSLASRGRALAALGRTDEAFRDYQSALDHAPLPEYALEAGELYQSLGLDGDAASQYARLRKWAERAGIDGVNEELVLGLFEADHGDDLDAAVRRLQAEWDRGHRSMYVADALGWALFRAGNAEDALPHAKTATDQGMRSALFAYHRGEIERALDLPGPARRHLGEALRINPYFSPLLAPEARDALDELGEPPPGGPEDLLGYDPEEMEAEAEADSASPSPSPSGSDSGAASADAEASPPPDSRPSEVASENEEASEPSDGRSPDAARATQSAPEENQSEESAEPSVSPTPSRESE
ncbi:tetratricopeptide repeat protein [Streptomyces sp. ISL-1]|uniref:tetratricopeptide repeat protein n=1 Tax=Streptomyces sp. ISL-1 TaxID=2817657 RepID=UPI001BECD96F|nr:tetratricopeptide repeat protein [Streptomyces sp. ISL-1]MBT2389677.1 tetratricopeptide repeat protein [Streptomyces sp. ISL-1]